MSEATALVFSNVRLVGAPDAVTTSVSVLGGTIAAVGSDMSKLPSQVVVDGGGRTLMPGLIDAHLHILGISTYSFKDWILEEPTLHAARAVNDMQALVDAGFTTVRDAGSDVSLALKSAQAEGSIRGPRVWASGRWISVTAGIPDISDLPICCIQGRGMSGVQVDGADACRHAVRSQVRGGADVIKIATTGGIDPAFLVAESTMASAELEAIIETAHDLGRRVTAHNNVLPGQRPTGILRALAAGIDAIDHGYHLEDRVLALMAERGCFWIVTCSYLKLVSERGPEAGLSGVYTDKAKMAWDAVFDAIPRARSAGVPIAIGSDLLGTPLDPHGLNGMELVLMREAGFSDREVIDLATIQNAQALGIDGWTGAIRPGASADLILVNGKPDEDVRILADSQNIPYVMVAGVEMKNVLGRAGGQDEQS